MFQAVTLTFICKRDGKPAPPVVMSAGVPSDVAQYLRTSEVERIDIDWTVPNLSAPGEFQVMDAPRVIIPGEQFFRQNKIDLSKKDGVLKWPKLIKK